MAWDNEEFNYFLGNPSIFKRFYNSLINILQIIFGMFLLSNITSIYIKTTIICAPIFIMMMSKKI